MSIERHRELHHSLDELVACFIASTGRSLRETSIMQLMEWSHRATIEVERCYEYSHRSAKVDR